MEAHYDEKFSVVFDAIDQLMMPAPELQKQQIGFIQDKAPKPPKATPAAKARAKK
jgi:hypothetical protein